MALANCWEIKDCGREVGGVMVLELGQCIVSKNNMGHSCWSLAGTLCGGEVQGTAAQKEGNCILCGVYQKYHRNTGADRLQVVEQYSEEHARYEELMRRRLKH